MNRLHGHVPEIIIEPTRYNLMDKTTTKLL
jgi:hypothetical protein